jgi:hypothetical protein
MAVTEEMRDQLAVRCAVLLPHLNERQRRLMLATEARLLGNGGVRAAARIAGVSETTVRKGVDELEAGEQPLIEGRVRRPGGGRRSVAELDPGLLPALLALVEPDERGDPMSPLRWTTKSLRSLAGELTRQGHPVSAMTVGNLLKDNGFSLQAQAKVLEGEQHPDRDVQFRYINEQVKQQQAAGEPVISVDTKKKEMLGQLPNPGRQWRPKGDPVQVDDHSFFSGPTGEAAIPYGVYDLTADSGWVNVGVDHDTSAFAVASIGRWWQARGRLDYPRATRLLITADAGGSNGYRYRLWKAELARLATQTGLSITVCHFPPGTSKWNKIEHRLFSHITMNWRGRPLTSHEVVVACVAATTTRSGLRVEAELDQGSYPLGLAVSKAELKGLPIEPHAERGTWNYTVRPARDAEQTPPPTAGADMMRRKTLDLLAEPVLTGMSREDLTALAATLAPELGALREQRLHRQRGGPRRQATGDHNRPMLSPADRVLLAVIYLRHVCSQTVLAEMLGMNQRTLGPSIKQIRCLLQENGVTIIPTTLCFSTGQQIRDFVSADTPGPARHQLSHALSDPRLTGMPRADLNALIDRLSVQQAALIENRRHRQRGGPRQPGTRGGVFRQKITDAERMLAAVLNERKIANRQVLSTAFGISFRTLSNALADALPVLREAGITIRPAAFRFTRADDILTFVHVALPNHPSSNDTPTG